MHKIRREDMKRYITDPEILSYLDKGFDEASFVDYVEKIAAPHYGVTVDEIYANSSPKEFLAEVSVPLLIVHAEDDPICPPQEMEELKSVEEENPFVKIWMLPSGNHCMFRYLDRKWYEEVSRSFFEYWARWE
jgi:predicted alpha/beta-fold hydrolase